MLMRHHLFLLKELVKRDVQSRYAGSWLGLLWSFVQPLWMLLLYTFVFSAVLKIPLPDGLRTDNFAAFLFCGLLPWMAIQEGVSRASTAVTDNAALVKKLRFPAEILILSVVMAALIHEAIAGAIFLVALAVTGDLAWQGLPLLLLALPLQVALTLGLGLLLGSVHVFFRDIAQVLGMVLTGWFYLTPIVYPLDMVPERLQPWIAWNPLTSLVELYRQALLGGRLALVPGMAGLVVAALVLLFAGSRIFARLKASFPDEI